MVKIKVSCLGWLSRDKIEKLKKKKVNKNQDKDTFLLTSSDVPGDGLFEIVGSLNIRGRIAQCNPFQQGTYFTDGENELLQMHVI